MADAALFVGFGPAARARELQALELVDRALALYERLRERGEIESVEPVLLDAHGGDLAGFVLLRGDRAALDRVVCDEEFRRVSARAGLVVEGFGVVAAHIGDGARRQLELYREEVTDQLGA